MATRPYELYLRFLVTRGKDLADTNTALEELSLPEITNEDYTRHHDLVHKTVPKAVSDQIADQKFEGDFLRWMKVLEVDELWKYEPRYRTDKDRYIRLVYDIHQDPSLRISLNSLLMKGVTHVDICQGLNLKFAYILKPEHLAAYQKLFWDPRRMTRGDWRSYLSLAGSEEKLAYFRALTEDLDTVKSFLDLPSKTSVPDALQSLLTNAYVKAKHYLKLGTPESNKEARSWISTTMALVDKYEKHRTGDMEDFKKTIQLSFDYIDSEFPIPDEATRKAIADARTALPKNTDA